MLRFLVLTSLAALGKKITALWNHSLLICLCLIRFLDILSVCHSLLHPASRSLQTEESDTLLCQYLLAALISHFLFLEVENK